MLNALPKPLYEFIRCTRSNVMRLRRFRISYGGGLWQVRGDGVQLKFPYYPYLAFHDIEGYLKNGAWKLRPGDVVIDAGACDGEFAIFASKCVGPTGRVLMIEPDPANIARARRNLELNGNPDNVVIVAAGLWNRKEVLRFAAGQAATSSVKATAGGEGVIEIPTVTFADLIENEKLDRIDFVKIDIEGAEIEALENLPHLPPQFRPRFAIASYHQRDGDITATRVERMLRDLRYNVETGNERHLTTWAEIKSGDMND